MQAVLAFLPTLFTIMGDLPKVMAAIQFLITAVGEIESTGQTGEQKLDAVLNSFEAYLTTNFPTYAQPFETIAVDVEAVVNAIVSAYNEAAALFGKPSTIPVTK
jgi:hypothetical protein